MVTMQEFAKQLDGREYEFELTNEELATAAANKLVVIYGRSDDRVIVDGADSALYSEISIIYFNAKGAMVCEDDPDDVVRMATEPYVKTGWMGPEYDDYDFFVFETNIPHATFDVMENYAEEDGTVRKYCQAIVFSLDNLGKAQRTVTNLELDHKDCQFSTDINDEVTSGQGECNDMGYFSIPCFECASKMEDELAEEQHW
jgi:hypothetical protein